MPIGILIDILKILPCFLTCTHDISARSFFSKAKVIAEFPTPRFGDFGAGQQACKQTLRLSSLMIGGVSERERERPRHNFRLVSSLLALARCLNLVQGLKVRLQSGGLASFVMYRKIGEFERAQGNFLKSWISFASQSLSAASWFMMWIRCPETGSYFASAAPPRYSTPPATIVSPGLFICKE